VLYPSRSAFTARPSTMANGNVASATDAADSVIIGGAAASHALVDECSASGSGLLPADKTFKSKLEVSIVRKDQYGYRSYIELSEYCDRAERVEPNAMMFNLFRTLPGFEADDDTPLTAKEHEAALRAFGSSANEKVEALIFEFPLLQQSISAKGENFESEKHMHVAKLSEQMATAEGYLASFGFERDEIYVRSKMSCG
jgi:hypothetical protein